MVSSSEAEVSPYYCLAFDPGETTGWAYLPLDDSPILHGQIHNSQSGAIDFLFMNNKLPAIPKVVVIEIYRILPQHLKAHLMSECPTIKVIGAIEAYATVVGAQIVMQETTIKTPAEAWTKLVPKGAHQENHWVDAVNHGAYFMVNSGKWEVQDARKKNYR